MLSSGFEPKSPLPDHATHLHQLSIWGRKASRIPVCLRVSLVPIFYHTLTVYSLPRETVIQDPLVIGDCYLCIIRIQTITYPSSVFLLYANRGFYTPHTNLTSSSHTTQPVSSGFIEWASVITTLHDFSHRFGRHPIESSQSCHR